MTKPDEAAAAAPAFDAPAEARRLLRAIRPAALATLTPEGAPFASLTAIATAPDGSPILLLSRLAAHTRHLEADPRCSLLLADSGKGDPLAHPRLTLAGRALRDADPALRARFLRRNPKAALYADFPDFSFWRFEVARAHLNGGFARAATLEAHELLTDLSGAGALVAAEADALDHMNDDHADALRHYARAFCGEADGPWRATGLDPEGMDLAAGERSARLVFPRRIAGPGELRACLVELVKARLAP